MQAASEEIDDPLFGLHCASAMPRGAYELFEFALRSAPNLLAALEHLDRYGDQLNPAVRFSIEKLPGAIHIHHRVNRGGDGVGAQGNVFTVARMLLLGREMLDESIQPSQVWFQHEERRPAPELQAFFSGAELSFGRSSNGLAFPAAVLGRTVKGADPALHAVLAQQAQRTAPASAGRTLRDQVAEAISKLLTGGVSVEKVAKRLHLSDRTLQRRLQEDGLQFAALVDEVRADTAKALLRSEEELAVSEIAHRLGYADAPTFARAFKRWTGDTPGAFRSENRRQLA
jgi:AraC-like DNA-binding protein